MIKIKESAKFGSDYSWEWGDYKDLIDTFEFEIVLSKDIGEWSGDTFIILKDVTRYGYLEYGWGSCPGCDSLFACCSHKDLENLQMQLFNSIRWFDSLCDLKEYFTTHDWEGDWVWHEEGHRKFRAEVLDLCE